MLIRYRTCCRHVEVVLTCTKKYLLYALYKNFASLDETTYYYKSTCIHNYRVYHIFAVTSIVVILYVI